MTIDTTVTLTELTPTPAVVLARRYERDTLDQTIDEAIRRVRKAVTAARVPTAGPPFVRFLSIGDRGEIEVGLPLDGPHVVPTLRATILPGGTAASAWHRGDESGILDLLRLVERWGPGACRPGLRPGAVQRADGLPARRRRRRMGGDRTGGRRAASPAARVRARRGRHGHGRPHLGGGGDDCDPRGTLDPHRAPRHPPPPPRRRRDAAVPGRGGDTGPD